MSSTYQLVSALALDASVQSPDLLRGVYNKETLLAETEKFQDHIYSQNLTESMLDNPQALALPDVMFTRLRDWISADASELLWIAGPTEHRYPSKMSSVATTVVELYNQAEPTTVFHLCELPDSMASEDSRTKEEVGLINLVYSMVQQLVCHVEPQFDSSTDFSAQRFASLDGTFDTLGLALELLKDLIPFCLPYIVFVIDGLERLDYGDAEQGCEDFLSVLRELVTMSEEGNGLHRVYKVLFTTAGKSGTLMRGLDAGEILLHDARRGELHIGRSALGRTAVAELEEYC